MGQRIIRAATTFVGLNGRGKSLAIGSGAVVGFAGGAGVGVATPSHPTIHRIDHRRETQCLIVRLLKLKSVRRDVHDPGRLA